MLTPDLALPVQQRLQQFLDDFLLILRRYVLSESRIISQTHHSNTVGQELLSKEVVPEEAESDLQTKEFVEDDSIPRSSINKKAKAGKYERDVYSLYRDLKFAAVSLLVQEPIGSEEYTAVFELFRFAVQTFIREAERLELTKEPERDLDFDKSGPTKAFESEISAGFEKVYTDTEELFGEAFFMTTQSGPMFSSLTGKASIDPRETETHGQMNVTKVLPYVHSTQGLTLGHSVPSTSKVPHPGLPPTELLRGFVHPNETPLPRTRWIASGEYESFAPSKDDSGALVPNSVAASAWFDIAGRKHIEQKAEAVEQTNGGDSMDIDAEGEAVKSEETPKPESEREATPKTSDDPTSAAATPAAGDVKVNGAPTKPAIASSTLLSNTGVVPSTVAPPPTAVPAVPKDPIDIPKLMWWSPANFIDDDELEAAENGTELELASKLLLELQNLQRWRLAHNDGSDFFVGEKERRLALKVRNILARAASDFTPRDLDLFDASQMAVLSVNYMGNLPVPETRPASQSRSSTRPAGRPGPGRPPGSGRRQN